MNLAEVITITLLLWHRRRAGTGDTFHGHMKELIDLMKNMTEAFGPFLLQNFSLLLLNWLLHLYVLIFLAIATIENLFIIMNDPTLMSMSCLQFGGSILIVRWAKI